MLLVMDGRNEGNNYGLVADRAAAMGLSVIQIGHQQIAVSVNTWEQLPKLLKNINYRSIQITSQPDFLR